MSHSHNPFQYHSAFPTENSWPRKSKLFYSLSSDFDVFLHLLLHELAGPPVDPVPLATFSLTADFCSDPSSQGLGVKWPCSLSSPLSLLNSFPSFFLGMPPWIECYQNLPIPPLVLTIISHILIVLSFILGVFSLFGSLFHSSFLFLSPSWLISTSTWMTYQMPCPLNLHSFLPVIFSSAPC